MNEKGETCQKEKRERKGEETFQKEKKEGKGEESFQREKWKGKERKHFGRRNGKERRGNILEGETERKGKERKDFTEKKEGKKIRKEEKACRGSHSDAAGFLVCSVGPL